MQIVNDSLAAVGQCSKHRRHLERSETEQCSYHGLRAVRAVRLGLFYLAQDAAGGLLAVSVDVTGSDAVIHGLGQDRAEILLYITDLEVPDRLRDNAVSIELGHLNIEAGDRRGQLAGAGEGCRKSAPDRASALGSCQPVLDVRRCEIDKAHDRIFRADILEGLVDGLDRDDVDLVCSQGLLRAHLQTLEKSLLVLGERHHAEALLVLRVLLGPAGFFDYAVDQISLGICDDHLHRFCEGLALVFCIVQHLYDLVLCLFTERCFVDSHFLAPFAKNLSHP